MPGGLEQELDRQPKNVEIGKMHDLAVGVAQPGAVNNQTKKQARNQEEIGHTEGLGESNDSVHPAARASFVLDTKN